MLDIIRKYPRAILYALIVHVVLVAILVVSFRWSDKPLLTSKDKGEEIVQAVTVDASRIDSELKKIQAAERKKQHELEQAAKRAEQARRREEKKLADAKKKRLAEQKALALERKQEQERVKKLAQERKQEQERVEKLAEERKKLEQERKELAEKRKQEEERLAKLEQQKREEELRKKLQAEQERLALESNKQKQSMINEYRAMIEAKVRQNWIVPASAREGMSCEVQVRLIPSGDVIQVQLTRSSGDPAFDRSVENAVHKASPLPVPPAESGLFDVFRDLKFPFTLEKKS